MRLALIVPAVVIAFFAGAVAAEKGSNSRRSVLAPGAKVFARFASARTTMRLRPFSDFEAHYCRNRTQEFLALAARTEVAAAELPGYMASLCQIHLCHFKRTGSVWQVNAVCGEVNTLFEERFHNKIAIDEDLPATAQRYCETIAQDPGANPASVRPLHAKEFVCPLQSYHMGIGEEIDDATARREEEDSTPKPFYAPVDAAL